MALRSTAEQASPRAGRTIGIDAQLVRKCTAEFLGTAILVFVGAGVATVTFGFHGYGASVAAGTVAVALAFGLALLGLVAMIGPISGCHVNPAITLGAYLTKRIQAVDAVGYVLAQLIGGIIGACCCYGCCTARRCTPRAGTALARTATAACRCCICRAAALS